MSDRNLQSFYETSNDTTYDAADNLGYPNPRPDWSDALKITSQCTNFTYVGQTVYGGQEDCVDINNRCKSVRVSAVFRPQGKYVSTIKGGSRGIILTGSVYGHGTEVDVDLGNWSDQSQETTRQVHLNLKSMDGKPIRVRVLKAETPTFEEGSGPYEYAWPKPDSWYHDLVVWFFYTFKRIFG